MAERVQDTPVLAGMEELEATVHGWGFWRLRPESACAYGAARRYTYAPLTTAFLERVLRGLKELP